MLSLRKEKWPWVKLLSPVSSLSRHTRKLITKTLMLFAVPLLFFVLASSAHIYRQSQHVDNLMQLDLVIRQAIQLSEVLHQLQKERGMAVIYLSSEGAMFNAQLLQQRQITDEILNTLSEISFVNQSGERLSVGIDPLRIQLEALRKDIDEFAIDTGTALSRYNNKNSKILSVINGLITENIESSLTKTFLGYVNFLREKELVGIERAILGSVFNRDKFLPGGYQYFVRLVTEQNIYRKEFLALASAQVGADIAVIETGPNQQKLQFYRDIAHTKAASGGFSVDSFIWFKLISNKIESFKQLEELITTELLANSEQIRMRSDKEGQWWLISLIFIIFLTLGYGLKLIQNINGSYYRELQAYRLLFENSSVAMLVISLKDQSILFCNSQFSRMSGYEQTQISGLKIADLYHQQSKAMTEVLFAQLAEGEMRFIEKLALLKRDGSTLCCDLSTFPIQLKNEKYLVVNSKDIAEKMVAQTKLQKTQLALQKILNSIDSAVSVIDCRSNKPIYLNDNAEALYKDRDQAEPLWPFLVPDSCAADCAVLEADNQEFTEQIYNKSHKRWYQISNRFIDWYDNEVVHLRMLEDITERYDAEHKSRNLLIEIRKLTLRNYTLQENERKQIAGDLHDQLGQLMTGIMLQANYIRRSVDSPNNPLQDAAQSIVETTQSLMGSVQEITNQLRPVLLDQLGLVEALRELVQQWQLLNRGTLFIFSGDDLCIDMPDLVAISLYRIVQESLNNASKHAMATEIKVVLQVQRHFLDDNKNLLCLKITDNGVGLDKDEAHFNGMGLINMRERVEALGGTYQLISKVGSGLEAHTKIPI
ncbi:MAG: hypothetical protein OFPI_02840 [Osedax symbiont Rs2]|nr:MAG: hypothetical protein OFPI_02840 [Osedax symbiont Rs2]